MTARTMSADPLDAIAALVLAEDAFLISTHLYPDGDAIASELALFHAFARLGKRAWIVNHSPTSEQYAFLPGIEHVRCLADAPALDARPSVLFSLDCGRFNRLGDVPARYGCARIINIDHHVTNNAFGELNLVRPEASSTGEILLELAVACGVELDLAIATCIYTAILSDTGRFCYANTSPRVHELAARLIALGVDPAEISREMFRSRSLAQLRLFALLVGTLQLSPDGRVAWATLSHAMCQEAGLGMIDTLDAVQIPISVRGVELGLLFRETDDPAEVKLSLRSEGTIDVAALASRFGGGGHPCASGCTLSGPLELVRDRTVRALLELVARP